MTQAVSPQDDDDAFDFIPESAEAAFGLIADFADLVPDDDDGGEQDEDRPSHTTPSISEGDFLDPRDHATFVNLKRRIRDACNVNSKRDVRVHALEWIFIPNTRDSKGMFFDASCLALGARPDVVRTRTAHQFWKAGVVFTSGLPVALAMRPPDLLMEEIAAKIPSKTGRNTSCDIARAAWYWPSIPADTLRQQFARIDQERYDSILRGLEAEGFVGMTAGRVYFISRNPALLSKAQRERFSFSEKIHTMH